MLDDDAFEGTLEFDVQFEIMGHKFCRRMRAHYTYTPEWEFCDLKSKALVTKSISSTVGFDMLTAPSEDFPVMPEEEADADAPEQADADEEPEWVPFEGFAGPGILPREAWDLIDDAIDVQCRAEDLERRKELAKPD